MKAAAIKEEPPVERTGRRVGEIGAALIKAEQELAELERGRGAVVLEGGDVDAYHLELFKASENVKTLTAGLDAARAQQDAALTVERIEQVEALAAAARTQHAPAVSEALDRMYHGLAEFCAAAETIAAATTEIEHANAVAENYGRADLVVSITATNAAAVRKLAGRETDGVSRASVTRTGETDEEYSLRLHSTLEQRASATPQRGEKPPDFERRAPGATFAKQAFVATSEGEEPVAYEGRLIKSIARALNVPPFLGSETDTSQSADETWAQYRLRVWAMAARKLAVTREGESDAAYQSRVLRQRGKEDDRVAADNPLKKLGERALTAILEHALGLSPSERRRMFASQVQPASLKGQALDHSDTLVQYGQRYIRSIRAMRG